MKKLTIIVAGLLLFVPSLAFSDSFSFRLGYFIPRASDDIALHPDSLWAIEFDQMSFLRKDFQNFTLGLGYEYFLAENLSLALTLDYYSRDRLGFYLDYDQADFTDYWFAFPIDGEPAVITDWYYIEHGLKVTSAPLQVSLKFLPLGRRARLIPFVGGGAGVYFWSAEMYGEMVDFYPVDDNGDPVDWYYDYETDTAYSNPADPGLMDQPIYPVTSVNARERDAALGFHAFAGFEFPIGRRATIEAEARYHWAKGRFRRWFEGFEDFDLGGLALTVGFKYWF